MNHILNCGYEISRAETPQAPQGAVEKCSCQLPYVHNFTILSGGQSLGSSLTHKH